MRINFIILTGWICLSAIFGTVDLFSQTNWVKYPVNPILSQGAPGSWSDEGFPFIYVMEIEDTLRMWFTASDQANDRIGYATSIDGISWNLYTDTLLDVGSVGTFDEEGVFGAQIVYDSLLYRMWYNGYDTQPYYAGNLRVGYATSSDGINWTKYGETPVLDLGSSGSWDSFWAYVNTVLYEGGEYKMWYSGFDGVQGLRIGYATSSDGVNWTKYAGNPVMTNGSSGVWDAVHVQNSRVIHNGSIYEMWYNGSNGSNGNAVGYATSSDGINWTKHPDNPVLPVGSTGSFDSQWLWSPCVLQDGNVNRMWYSGYDGSIWRIGYATDSTNNGGTNWTVQSSGTTYELYGVSFIDANTGMAVGRNGIILRTSDGGANWTAQPSGTTNDLRAVSFIDAFTGTVVGDNGTILHTTDGGESWTAQSGTSYGLCGVSFTDANTGTAVGDWYQILHSTDGGANWTFQSNPGGAWNIPFTGVSIIDANTGTAVGVNGIILHTSDGGANWTTQSSGTTSGLRAVSFTDAFIGTVVGDNGTILHTTDGGESWTAQSGTSYGLWGVSFTDANTGTAVGEGGTILHTTDGGASWTIQSSGTMNTLYGVSFTDANTGTAVGDGGTILRTTAGGVSAIEEYKSIRISSGFSLQQNYPNPFNPSTVISYRLPVTGFVSLKVYDVLGNEVANLVNEEKEAGVHSLNFNATQLSSGVYFYQLKAGDFIQARKMNLLR